MPYVVFTILLLKVSAISCHFPTKSIKAFEESGQSISNKRVQPFPLEMRIKHPAKQRNIEAYNTSYAEFDQILHLLHSLLARDFHLLTVFYRQFHKFTTAYCRSKKISP